MKARPILMASEMVRATLREIEKPGTGKSQTRRIVKPPAGYRWLDMTAGTMANAGGHKKHISDLTAPYGQPGGLLYVRETWTRGSLNGALAENGAPEAVYRADDNPPHWTAGCKWVPAIHMPRWASRLTLRITDVRVERLQDISEADARAEGVEPLGIGYRDYDLPEQEASYDSARPSFESLWRAINGPGSSDANPWIWAISFEPILRNVDAVRQPLAAA